ncbi:S41 family peptidase [Agriterribacter sp.]|uniref:S41 family peptidase n=1 Tax=Agriterribacter sp. TaxID=2821509 RepID=UPI002C2AE9A2|nr:S41 family peptidase [Agriterribacter sp.]HRP54876.1 S41 family peptidase [Agriterribacter sp.]
MSSLSQSGIATNLKIQIKILPKYMKLFILFFLYFSCCCNAFTQVSTNNRFSKKSNISSISLTASHLENLTVLGKVWGYLKYYHPAVCGGKYDWDYELFKIMSKVLLSKNKAQCDKIIINWIDTLGIVEKGDYNKTDTSLIKIKPDYSWIKSPDIGKKLISQLELIKNAKRPDISYYVSFDTAIPNPVFKNENAYSELKYPDTGYRLLALFRYWNIIQYFYPYRNLIQWDSVLKEFIPKFINASDETTYKLTILSLTSRIHDTHANVPEDKTLAKYKGTKSAPFEIRFVEHKAVVTDYLDEYLGKKEYPGKGLELQKGDIIEEINNKTIDFIIKERLLYTPASNYTTQLREIGRDLLRTRDSVIVIRFRRNNIARTVHVKCYPLSHINLFKRYQQRDTCFKMVAPGIAYINPWTIKAVYIPAIMEMVSDTKGLILDLRNPPGDDILSIGDYLFHTPTTFVKASKGNQEYPGLFTFFFKMTIGKQNANIYKGKTIILVNEDTQSTSEFHAMAFRAVPNSKIIGSTTAAADGNVSDFYLPGGVMTSMSGLGIYYPDGRETQITGILPDIECKPTVSGIIANRDELIDKSIEIINKRNGI